MFSILYLIPSLAFQKPVYRVRERERYIYMKGVIYRRPKKRIFSYNVDRTRINNDLGRITGDSQHGKLR